MIRLFSLLKLKLMGKEKQYPNDFYRELYKGWDGK